MLAIDRETRRRDQLERGVAPYLETDELWDEELPATEPIPPSEVKIPIRDPRRKSSGAKAAPAGAAVAPRAPVAVSPPPSPSPSPSSSPPSGSTVVQPLPPPIDIKPAPGVMRMQKQRPAAPAGTF